MSIISSNIKPPHWIVGDMPVFNQVEAWHRLTTTKQSYRFYFYEDQYDTLDWTREPLEDWDTLVENKLLLLRARYKHLSLFYSGGRDSHMILRHFYKTGVPLDEIVLNYNPTVKNRVFELENYIMPQVKLFRERYPQTAVRLVKNDEGMYQSYFKEDWIFDQFQCMRVGLFFPVDFGYFVKTALDPDPNNGYIVGVDKPRLWIEDGKVYSVVVDKTLEPFYTDLPNLELFFYSPDYPVLYLKQNWMMLRYLESNFPGQLNEQFVRAFCDGTSGGPVMYDHLCLSCGRGPAFDLSLNIQNGQTKPAFTRMNDVNFFDQALSNYRWKSAKNWQGAKEQVTKLLSEDMFKNSNFREGFTGILSKKYLLKDLNTIYH